MRIINSVSVLAICWAMPAGATNVSNFDDFYTLYKTATAQNDITITSEITATRLISVPGAATTNIDGGGMAFDGAGYSGFTVSNGYNFLLENGGTFSGDTITSSYNNFVNSNNGGVISNLGGHVTINNSAFVNNTSGMGGGVIYQDNNGDAIISNAIFQSNNATRGDGGVIYNEYEFYVFSFTRNKLYFYY